MIDTFHMNKLDKLARHYLCVESSSGGAGMKRDISWLTAHTWPVNQRRKSIVFNQ